MRVIVRQLGALNFLRFAALGLYAPFVTIYLTEQGLSATQIGLLISVGSFLELILAPIFNTIADRTNRHRLLYIIFNLCISLSTLLFAIALHETIIIFAFLLNQVTMRPSIALLSQLTVTRLDEFNLNIFGKLRLRGSIGWAITSILNGTLIAVGSYALTFFMAFITNTAKFIFIPALPSQTNANPKNQETAPRQRAFYIILTSQFFFHGGVSAFFSFLWIYLEADIQIPLERIGWFAAFIAITEMLPMQYVDSLMERFNIRLVAMGGMLGMSLIWLIYGVIPTVGWLVLLHLVYGLFFTMNTVAMVLLVARISAPVNVATNQALIQVTMPALAMLITSPIAGWLYDNVGPNAMFLFSGLMGLIGSGILMVNYRLLINRQKRKVIA